MDACILPPTGFEAPVVAMILVAAAVLAAGIVLATARRGRRTVAHGLGALALVGALAAVGIGGAQPAFADTGRCVTAPAPTPDPTTPPSATPTPTPTPDPLIEVTPDAPTTAAQCGAEPLLTVPEQEGLDFVQQRAGDDLTIVATPLPGYVVTPGAQSVFEIDMTPSPYAPWPVDLPEEVVTAPGEGYPSDGGLYLLPADPTLVPALQAAQDEGSTSLRYAIDGSEFSLAFAFDVFERDSIEVIYSGVAHVRIPVSFSYDQERDEYLLGWDEEDEFAAYDATRQELEDTYDGDAQIVGYSAAGLRLTAEYVPGPLCDLVTDEAPVTIDLDGGAGDAPGSRVDALIAETTAALDAAQAAAAAQSGGVVDASAPDAAVSDAAQDDAALDVLPTETR